MSIGELFSIEYLADMSLLGWIGILLMLVVPVLLIVTFNDEYKNAWFMVYEERFPQFGFVDALIGDLGEGAEIGWLVARLILMQVIFVALGILLMMIAGG